MNYSVVRLGFGNAFGNATEFELHKVERAIFFFNAWMPALSKRTRMLDEVATYHAQQKRARTLRLVTEFLDDLPSSDPPAHSDDSDLSPSSLSGSSISSPSSGVSDPSSSPLHSAHSGHSSSDSGDFDSLEDRLLEQWDTQVQELATYLLTARMLEVCPPVQKLGQLGLYLTNFQHDHPDRFRKKLRVSPPVFDRLVELIEDNGIFHNNSWRRVGTGAATTCDARTVLQTQADG
jgi:hypothetical protein